MELTRSDRVAILLVFAAYYALEDSEEHFIVYLFHNLLLL